MIEQDVIQRIKEICEHRHWSIYRLAKESNLPYSSLNNMFVRGTCPTIMTLEKICAGLQISLPEFFAFTEPPPTNTNDLDYDEEDLLYAYRALSGSDQKLVKAYIQGLRKL